MPITSYRFPGERLILGITLLALLIILGLTAGATLCLAPLVVLVLLILAFLANRAQHQQLIQSAAHITPQQTPGLAKVAEDCTHILRIPPNQVDFFALRNQSRNAYTFGLTNPKGVVIYSALLEILTPDELRFVVGHELGHIALGHAWLNSLLGGMAGIPTTLEGAVILALVFRWWNRACEYSADRAGLLACKSLSVATSTLVKIAVGQVHNQAEMQQALSSIDQEDNLPAHVLAEAISTHPMIGKRIAELKKYASSAEYVHLQSELNLRLQV